jgi:hypothetical protein
MAWRSADPSFGNVSRRHDVSWRRLFSQPHSSLLSLSVSATSLGDVSQQHLSATRLLGTTSLSDVYESATQEDLYNSLLIILSDTHCRGAEHTLSAQHSDTLTLTLTLTLSNLALTLNLTLTLTLTLTR